MELDQAQAAEVAGVMAGYSVVCIIIAVIVIVALWKIFTKAGEAGWKAIIPFLNLYVLFKITWGNGWFFLLTFIPLVNFVVCIMTYWKLAKAFGFGVGMFLLILFFPYIALPVIGFGKSQYVGA